jgi:hypothetical protein
MTRRYYAADPKWITVKYTGKCSRCHTVINAGTRAFYYPNGKRLYCSSDHCGGNCDREFQAAAFDEDFASAGY